MKVMLAYGGFENLGLEYISSVLKENGYKTELAFDPMLFDDTYLQIKSLAKVFNYRKRIIKRIIDYSPDILGFSVISPYYSWALSIAGEIKKTAPEIHISFGGIHPTSAPDSVIMESAVDSIIIGEGELSFLKLADMIKKGRLDEVPDGVWIKRSEIIVKGRSRKLIADLDSLPFPDKELFYSIIPGFSKGYNIITRRGCVNTCSYCYSPVWKKVHEGDCGVRFRSPENVLIELIENKKRYNYKILRINDDIFTLDNEWLKEFSKGYIKNISVPFFCFGNAKTIDSDTVSILKEMNCYQLNMGVQSINPVLRREVLNRNDDNKKTEEVIKMLRSKKIRCVVDNLMGIPGETRDDYIEMARFYNKTRPSKICLFYLKYYPSLPIIEAANERNTAAVESESISSEKNSVESANTLPGKMKPDIANIQLQWLIYLRILPRFIYETIIRLRLFRLFIPVTTSFLTMTIPLFTKERYDVPRTRYVTRYFRFLFKKVFN